MEGTQLINNAKTIQIAVNEYPCSQRKSIVLVPRKVCLTGADLLVHFVHCEIELHSLQRGLHLVQCLYPIAKKLNPT